MTSMKLQIFLMSLVCESSARRVGLVMHPGTIPNPTSNQALNPAAIHNPTPATIQNPISSEQRVAPRSSHIAMADEDEKSGGWFGLKTVFADNSRNPEQALTKAETDGLAVRPSQRKNNKKKAKPRELTRREMMVNDYLDSEPGSDTRINKIIGGSFIACLILGTVAVGFYYGGEGLSGAQNGYNSRKKTQIEGQ
mmetsp:Transcript_119865/g.188009  ORF Transcript_119865/g.188009 Transcript_119865/m.188009 type:complete len:195 (-) Transcript_119865:145-729(-)